MQDNNQSGSPITPLAQPYDPVGGGQPAAPVQPMPTYQSVEPVAEMPLNQAPPMMAEQPVAATVPEVTMSTPQPAATTPVEPIAGPTPMMSESIPPTPPTLSDAPQSFIQREPSSFDIGANVPKRKKRFPFFSCFCGLFFVFFLIFGGLTAVAYFTDTEIPFFSDLAAKIEELINGNELTAEQVQQQVADTLLGAMLPFVADNEGLMSAVAKTTISDEYIQNFVTTNGGTESIRFEIDAAISSSDAQSGLGNIEGKFIGAMDSREDGNEKFETTVAATMESQGTTLSASGAMKVIGPVTYLKVNEMPPLLPGYENIVGKWIETEATDVEQVAENAGAEEQGIQEITEQDVTDLKSFITDPAVIKNVEALPDETIKGNETKCLRLSWNKEELKEVIKRYDEIFAEEYNEQEVDEALDGLTLLQMEACLGTETNNIHRIKLFVQGNQDSNSFSYTVNAQLWDYNKDMNITAPTDSITFDEVMQGTMTESKYLGVEGKLFTFFSA